MNCILLEFDGTEKNYPRGWMWWHMPIIASVLKARNEDHLSLRDQDQPGQHRFYLERKREREREKLF